MKAKTQTKFKTRLTSLAIYLMLFSSSMFAQCADLPSELDFPLRPQLFQWSFNASRQEVHVFRGYWMRIDMAYCIKASRCGNFMLLRNGFESEGSLSWLRGGYTITDTTGKILANSIAFGYVADSSLIVWPNWSNGGEVLNARGEVVGTFTRCGAGENWTGTVEGIEGVCVPGQIISGLGLTCGDLRNWGIMGENGQWLIEPKFDAPFYFQDGIADVVYYGQKRKINEKGEFME
jgi:hypothetical protein